MNRRRKPSVPDNDFERFRKLVLANEVLQLGLRELRDKESFVQAVVELGSHHGFEFSRDDVEDAMRAGRRAWIEHRL